MIKISFSKSDIPDIEAPNLTVAIIALKKILGALNVWSIVFEKNLEITIKYKLIKEELFKGEKGEKK